MATSTAAVSSVDGLYEAGPGWFEWMAGERLNIRTSSAETGYRYTVVELAAVPTWGTPLHIHTDADEHFIILEGVVHFALGDQELDAPAGTTVLVPKGVRHAWYNASDSLIRMLLVFAPGGMDACFRDMATAGGDMEKVAEASARQGTVMIGPAPWAGRD